MNKGLIIGIFAISSFSAFAQTDILNEGFQSGLPAAFTVVDNDGLTPDASTAQFTEAWTLLPDPLNPSDTVMGSTSFFDPTGTADRWLITPPLVLGASGNYLNWDARSHDPSYPDDYKVLVSTTDNQLASFTDTIGLVQQEFATWFSRTVNLSANGYDGETIYVAFVNTTNDGFALYVDSIRATIDDPGVGLNELEEVAVTVYPNPVSNVLNIESVATIESIEVVSLSGSRLLVGTKNEIDVSVLKSGSYFVKIQTDRGSAVRPFMKQ